MLVQNYYSTGDKQHPDRLVKSCIESVFMLARSEMAKSGLEGKHWFRVCTATYGKDCRKGHLKGGD
jgi:hypothetical protein